jgi:O-antigen/teichoic acid export membrane protein
LSGSIFNFIFSSVLIFKKTEIRPRFALDKNILLILFKIAYPFALAGLFVKIYSYLDSVFLSKLVGDTAVGFWSVAYKLTYSFQFIPMAFAAAMFPAMSAYFAKDRSRLKQTFERATFYLALLAVPISFGIFSLAKPIVLTLYGPDYLSSVLPLQIAVFTAIFIFLNYPIGSLLNACDRQMTNTLIMGASMALNIILNIVLIPRLSFVGAAISTLISHSLLYILGMIFANKIVVYGKAFIFGSLAKILVSAGVMSAVIIYLNRFISFWFLIPLGGLIYFGVLCLFRGIGKDDIVGILKALKKEKAVEMIDNEGGEI